MQRWLTKTKNGFIIKTDCIRKEVLTLKKFISFALFAILVFALSVTAFAAETVASGYCGGEGDGTNLSWTLDSNGVLTISGTGTMKDFGYTYTGNGYETVSAPWMSHEENIRKIIIEDGVSSIGEYAFNGLRYIENLILSGSVKKIGTEAFRDCFIGGDFVIPEGVESIERWAFAWNNFTSVSLPSTLKYIDSDAFYICSSLERYEVSEQNEYYSSVDGLLCTKDKTKLISFPEKKDDTYELPDCITEIGELCFHGIENNLILGENIKKIEREAFALYIGTVTVKGRIQSIASEAFCRWGGNFNEINVYFMNGSPIEAEKDSFIPDEYCTIRLFYAEGTEDLWEFDENGLWNGLEVKPFISSGEAEFDPEDYIDSGYCGAEPGGKNVAWGIDENGVLTIFGKGKMADYSEKQYENFWATSASWGKHRNFVSAVVIENGIENIGAYAFYGMRYIQDIEIPGSVKEIREYAFQECYSLDGELVLPEGLEKIAERAFVNSRYTSVSVPSTLVDFNGYSFCWSYNLEKFEVSVNHPFYCDVDGVIYSKDKKELVLYPCGRVGKYDVPESVETINRTAFLDVTADVVLGENIKTISSYAFTEFNGSIVIEGRPEKIEEAAFWDWSSSYNAIKIYFMAGEPLAADEYIISGRWGQIIEFYYLSGTEHLWDFDENGLWNGYEVKPFIPNGEVKFDPEDYVDSGYCGAEPGGKNVAWGLDENGTFKLFGKGKMIDYDQNYGDSSSAPWEKYKESVSAIIIENGIENIGNYAFFYFNKIETDIYIPESVKTIGDSAFAFATGTIVINGRPERIGERAFSSDYRGYMDLYFMNGSPKDIHNLAFSQDVDLYYLAGTEDLWEFDENGLWNGFEVTRYDPNEEIEFDPYYYIASGYCGAEPGGKNLAWGIDKNGVLNIFGKGEMADYKYGRLENGQWGVNSPWYQYRNDISDIKMEEGITRISNSAFWGIFDIKDLVIPQSVTSIGSDAFHTAIKGSITIPAAVTEIGSCPFGYCIYLKEINVAKNNPAFASKDGKLYSKDMKTLYAWPNIREEKRAVVPDGVVTIAEGAFNCLVGMDMNVDIVLPETVKIIKESAIFTNGRVIVKGQLDFVSTWACSPWNGTLSFYFFNGPPKEANEYTFDAEANGPIGLYYLSGTEDLWSFDENGLWNGYEVKEYNCYGDINIDFTVDVKDVYLARLIAAKLVVPTEMESSFGDVDGDGKITAIDANIIRKFAVGIIDKFPVKE